jgi:DNA repair protein RecN (Recombination protein N)
LSEIDPGIGGQVSLALASPLRALADHTQVICITHLAPIAVRADNHIVVEKRVTDGTTQITTRSVTGEERTEEIARMLSGDRSRATSLDHARDLLERYRTKSAYGQN